jgi:hypothetical protein
MNKVVPKICKPGSDKMPTKGPHNTNVGRSGTGGTLAKLKPAGKSPAGSFLPMQNNANANLRTCPVEQPISNAASKKSNRKGGAAFYGER